MSLANIFNGQSVGGSSGPGPTTSNWADILLNGADSGATNPIISTTQKINYVDNIKIDSQLVTAPILIGSAAVASGNDSIAIGNAASSGAFTSSVAIGKSATNTANNQIALGSSTIATIAPGGISIGSGVPTNTTSRLLTLSSTAGVPTGVVEGALIYDSTNKLFMARDNISWKPVQTAATATPAWSATLAVSNVSGANDVKISANQQATFTGGVNIGSGNVNNVTAAPANSSVLIGGSVTGSGLDCVDIGASTNSGALQGCVCIGSGASSSGTGGGTSVGWNSSSGTGCTAVGWLSTTAGAGSNSTAIGVNTSTGGFGTSTAIGAGAVCTAANQVQIATNTETTSIRGALVMNPVAATNTTLAGLITLGKVAGTPTGAASSGSVVYDSTNNLFYARDNASWKQIQIGTPATPTIASVLTAGNTTNAGQALIFTSGVTIGSAAVAPATGTPAVNSVLIGGGTTGSGGNCVVIGRSATTSTFAFGTAIGAAATVNAANGTSIGYNAICAADSTALGYSANTSTSTQAISIGSSSSLGTLCTSSIVIGYGTTSLNSITDAIGIGRSVQLVSVDGIGIGRQTSASGVRSISIGAAAVNHANNSDCVLIGTSAANVTSGNTSNVAVGANISFTAGANSTNTIALGAGAVVPVGSVNHCYFPVNFASATSAAGTAVSIDASGKFHANTSSIRYKQDVQPLKDPERILNLRAVDYAMKNTEEYGMSCGCPAYILDEEGNSVKNPCTGIECGIRDVGGIAEEVCNAGCEDFVVFAPDPNDPNKRQCRSIKYDRLTMPIIEVLKKQKYRMEFLEDENLMLADKITTLQNSNDAMKVKLDWLESKIIQST